MKITQRAEFSKGAIQSKRGPIDKSQCAIIEIDGVRFFSLTPNDEAGAERINAAASSLIIPPWRPYWRRVFSR